MNATVEGNIVKVKRGTFTVQDTGEVRSYCQLYLLTVGETTENETGFDYKKYSVKVDNYNKIIDYIKANKKVTLDLTLVEQRDGSYRPRVNKIDDYKLV